MTSLHLMNTEVICDKSYWITGLT